MQPRVFTTSHRRPAPARRLAVLLAAIALLIVVEPVLANKFETIGGGFSGSTRFKREWLVQFLNIVGGISLFAALLSVVLPRNNALYLNYSNWKRSAIVLLVIAGALFAAAALI